MRSSRIVQIPLKEPVRNGTVLSVRADDPPTATLIEWDNGGEEWIRDEDFGRLHIWCLSDEKKEPPPTPLEDLLRALITQRRAPGGQP